MSDVLTDAMADAMWAAWLPSIDNVTNRIQDPDDFSVGPGSQLAADDDASDPYQVSHCARACLNAGVDHLHAAKALMFGAVPILHANSEYSLFRGALENLATAFWVLHPAQRSMRVERALRSMVKNFKDQDKAPGGLGLPDYIPGEVNVEHVVDIADRAGCDTSTVRKAYFSTSVLEYAEEHSNAVNVLLMWQACSGFAHGRQWANLAMNVMDVQSTSETTKTVCFTSDYKRLLVAAWPAFQLMNAAVELFTKRAQGHTVIGAM